MNRLVTALVALMLVLLLTAELLPLSGCGDADGAPGSVEYTIPETAAEAVAYGTGEQFPGSDFDEAGEIIRRAIWDEDFDPDDACYSPVLSEKRISTDYASYRFEFTENGRAAALGDVEASHGMSQCSVDLYVTDSFGSDWSFCGQLRTLTGIDDLRLTDNGGIYMPLNSHLTDFPGLYFSADFGKKLYFIGADALFPDCFIPGDAELRILGTESDGSRVLVGLVDCFDSCFAIGSFSAGLTRGTLIYYDDLSGRYAEN